MGNDTIDRFRSSFAAISDSDTEILILGSLPGERSLSENRYYAHPRNRFWKLILRIIESADPGNYEERLDLLLRSKIGLWDVVRSGKRKGSLDSNILEAIPNDLSGFISAHGSLKIIAFNGKKSQELYDKNFKRANHLKYLSLPSSSPANASFSFDQLFESWRRIFADRI